MPTEHRNNAIQALVNAAMSPNLEPTPGPIGVYRSRTRNGSPICILAQVRDNGTPGAQVAITDPSSPPHRALADAGLMASAWIMADALRDFLRQHQADNGGAVCLCRACGRFRDILRGAIPRPPQEQPQPVPDLDSTQQTPPTEASGS